jgi:carbonic anhydrase
MALPSASAHVLGIKPGEAVVIRNIGGRITQSWVYSGESVRLRERFPEAALLFLKAAHIRLPGELLNVG